MRRGMAVGSGTLGGPATKSRVSDAVLYAPRPRWGVGNPILCPSDVCAHNACMRTCEPSIMRLAQVHLVLTVAS